MTRVHPLEIDGDRPILGPTARAPGDALRITARGRELAGARVGVRESVALPVRSIAADGGRDAIADLDLKLPGGKPVTRVHPLEIDGDRLIPGPIALAPGDALRSTARGRELAAGR